MGWGCEIILLESYSNNLIFVPANRITTGSDKGAYCHAYFVRGNPSLVGKMIRTRVNGKGSRKPANPKDEPNLHQLPPLPHIPPNASIEIPTVTYMGNAATMTDSNGEDDFSDSEEDYDEDGDSYNDDLK